MNDKTLTAHLSMSAAPPYGYRRLEDGGIAVLTAEAEVLRLIFELFLRHRRKKTVARLLNDAGYRTRTGAEFSDTAVDRLLRDPAYYSSPVAPSGIEPIITAEIWKQANAVLNSSQKLGKQTAHLFAGLVYCRCGGKMNVPSNSPKYVCAECRHKIGAADLEEIFRAQLAAFPAPAASTGTDTGTSGTIADYWQSFTKDEKRILIEQLVNRILIGTRDIHIEFGW